MYLFIYFVNMKMHWSLWDLWRSRITFDPWLYWDTLSTYHTCPKTKNSPFYYPLMYLKYYFMYGKQCRPWSDAAFCGIWSGTTLFAKVYLFQFLGLLPYDIAWDS